VVSLSPHCFPHTGTFTQHHNLGCELERKSSAPRCSKNEPRANPRLLALQRSHRTVVTIMCAICASDEGPFCYPLRSLICRRYISHSSRIRAIPPSEQDLLPQSITPISVVVDNLYLSRPPSPNDDMTTIDPAYNTTNTQDEYSGLMS
jgi:hypothetical protein